MAYRQEPGVIIIMRRGKHTHVLFGVSSIRYFHQKNTLPVWVIITPEKQYEFSDKHLSMYTDIAYIDGMNLYWMKRSVNQATKIEFVFD